MSFKTTREALANTPINAAAAAKVARSLRLMTGAAPSGRRPDPSQAFSNGHRPPTPQPKVLQEKMRVDAPVENYQARPLADSDVISTGRNFPYQKQWLLFLLRTILVITAISISVVLLRGTRHAVHAWHTYDIQRQCDIANSIPINAGMPSSLPSGIGASTGADLVHTLVILLFVHILFGLVSIPMACTSRVDTQVDGATLCCCIDASVATSVVAQCYRDKSARVVLVLSALLLLTALGVAIAQLVAMGAWGEWDIAECAKGIETEWLHTGRNLFPLVPLALVATMTIDVCIIVTVNSADPVELPTHRHGRRAYRG
jgi:hypothetical protein